MSGRRVRVPFIRCACGGLLLHATVALGQRAGARPDVPPPARAAVDAWLVTRFHDVQLIDDSLARAPSSASLVPPVRVESARDGDAVDTLFATHLGVARELPAYRVGARLRLGASSGSISNIPATVLARRFFRAPVRPISARPDSAWRYGWAYVLTTTAVSAKVGATTYRGWLLFAPADSARRARRPSSPSSR